MSTTGTLDPVLAMLKDDIAALKRDVTKLLAHTKASVADGTQSAAGFLDDGTRRLYRGAAEEGGRAVSRIGDEVRKQPVAAVLLVLVAGYIGGRLLSRR
jgi:hypothetical protein